MTRRPVFDDRPYAERVRLVLTPLKASGVRWEDAWNDAMFCDRPPLDWGGWRPSPEDPGIDPLPDGEGLPNESPLRFLHRHMRLAYLNLPGTAVALSREDVEYVAA